MDLLALDDDHLEAYVAEKSDIMHLEGKHVSRCPTVFNSFLPCPRNFPIPSSPRPHPSPSSFSPTRLLRDWFLPDIASFSALEACLTASSALPWMWPLTTESGGDVRKRPAHRRWFSHPTPRISRNRKITTRSSPLRIFRLSSASSLLLHQHRPPSPPQSPLSRHHPPSPRSLNAAETTLCGSCSCLFFGPPKSIGSLDLASPWRFTNSNLKVSWVE